jgi:hypothetical protein
MEGSNLIKHEVAAFEDEEIRDTSSHNSGIADNIGYSMKTIIVENGLNQTVTFQCQASRDGVNHWFNVGSSFDVSASTDTYQTCDAYFPFMRVQAQCGTAPTSGSLGVFFERIPEE